MSRVKMYTEAQVTEIIQSNLNLVAENTALRDKLSKEALQREEAEKKYANLCERCITAYATCKDIITDSLLVQVSAPRFMSESDFETGMLQHIIKSLKAKRGDAVFIHEQTQSRRDKNDT